MSENTVTADANAAPEASAEVDAQLAEMQTAEGAGEATKDPATGEGDAGEGSAAPEVKKVVPLAALHEERKARQELQRQIAERDRKQAERDAIIERRLAALANPQQQAPARPDPVEQPVAYLDHRLDGIERQNQAILQDRQQEHEARQQQEQVRRLENAVIMARNEFAKTTPDISDAAVHLNTVRARELMALGAPESAARQQASQELDHALMSWAAQGRNPAEIAYEFAKARGYAPKAAAPAQPAPADKIAAQQKGTAAARSLGSGGAVSGGKLTAEALANMSEEDFSKITEAQFRQAMGG